MSNDRVYQQADVTLIYRPTSYTSNCGRFWFW